MTNGGSSDAVSCRRAAAASSVRWLLPSVLIVLVLRLVYLARFGWDSCGMNFNFLVEAKRYALGRSGEAHGLPLTPLLVLACRRIGLGPLAALGSIYIVGQMLFAVSSLVLFEFFVPGSTARRRVLFVLVLAVLPMLSIDTAYKDLAVILGAGLLLATFATALAAAADARPRPGRLVIAAIAGALATSCRTEGATAISLMALLLWRWRMSPGGALPRRIAAAVALLAGLALGIASTMVLSSRLRGPAQLSSSPYLFYTFYDGLPWLMRPRVLKLPSEYGRYLASVDLFGSFAANHGSLGAALLAHPGAAILRFVLKIPDLVAGASTPRGLTPLGLPIALVGMIRARDVGAAAAPSRAPLLFAFLGPIAVLIVPPASNFYFIAAAFPVLLAIAAGLDVLLARVTERALRRGAAAAVLAAAVLIALVGRTERNSSPTVNAAAAYLENECRTGCLLNYLPDSFAGLAWSDLEAGAALPEKIKRSEAFVTGRFPPGFAEGCRFDERLRLARARGYRGPVLYADMRVASTRLFSDQFDPERRLEGPVDLSHATLQRYFDDGGDSIAIYKLPPAP